MCYLSTEKSEVLHIYKPVVIYFYWNLQITTHFLKNQMLFQLIYRTFNPPNWCFFIFSIDIFNFLIRCQNSINFSLILQLISHFFKWFRRSFQFNVCFQFIQAPVILSFSQSQSWINQVLALVTLILVKPLDHFPSLISLQYTFHSAFLPCSCFLLLLTRLPSIDLCLAPFLFESSFRLHYLCFVLHHVRQEEVWPPMSYLQAPL